MNGAFTIGDSIKYFCVHEGKKLIIGNWELFDKDWGILKEKAEKWDRLTSSAGGVWNRIRYLEDKLETTKNQIDEFPCVSVQDYQRMMRKIKKILEFEG